LRLSSWFPHLAHFASATHSSHVSRLDGPPPCVHPLLSRLASHTWSPPIALHRAPSTYRTWIPRLAPGRSPPCIYPLPSPGPPIATTRFPRTAPGSSTLRLSPLLPPIHLASHLPVHLLAAFRLPPARFIPNPSPGHAFCLPPARFTFACPFYPRPARLTSHSPGRPSAHLTRPHSPHFHLAHPPTHLFYPRPTCFASHSTVRPPAHLPPPPSPHFHLAHLPPPPSPRFRLAHPVSTSRTSKKKVRMRMHCLLCCYYLSTVNPWVFITCHGYGYGSTIYTCGLTLEYRCGNYMGMSMGTLTGTWGYTCATS
jgi:hypothetical protein